MTFDEVFDRLIGHEGGYVNDSRDFGGETNWGISKRSYPFVDIKNLTRAQAKEIYRQDFWIRINGDRLYDGVAYQTFDFAVNSGIDTSVRALQRAIGTADDGHWGLVSQAAADTMSEADQIMRINAERLDFMTRLSNWNVYGAGWARRIAGNLRYGAIDA